MGIVQSRINNCWKYWTLSKSFAHCLDTIGNGVFPWKRCSMHWWLFLFTSMVNGFSININIKVSIYCFGNQKNSCRHLRTNTWIKWTSILAKFALICLFLLIKTNTSHLCLFGAARINHIKETFNGWGKKKVMSI